MTLPVPYGRPSARVWDQHFNLIGPVRDDALQTEEGQVVLNTSDPIAQFLIDTKPGTKWLTIESPTGRWIGRLRGSKWESGNNKRAEFTFEREPDEFYGFTKAACPKCGEVLFVGKWMPQQDLEDLHRIHNTHCGTE